MNLPGELLRGCREADPDSACLFPGNIAIGFEVAEDEVAYDFCRDLGREEFRRNLLGWRQAPEYPCPMAELEDAVLLPWPVRKGYVTDSCRFRLATQGGRDPRHVLLQGLRHVDEVDRRLAAHVAVADEVAE